MKPCILSHCNWQFLVWILLWVLTRWRIINWSDWVAVWVVGWSFTHTIPNYELKKHWISNDHFWPASKEAKCYIRCLWVPECPYISPTNLHGSTNCWRFSLKHVKFLLKKFGSLDVTQGRWNSNKLSPAGMSRGNETLNHQNPHLISKFKTSCRRRKLYFARFLAGHTISCWNSSRRTFL